MTSILLHSCCGPCSTYVVKHLQKQGFEVTLYWYNPNVHPYREHQNRLEAIEKFSQITGVPLIVQDGYDMIEYFRAVTGHEGNRCADCYRLRLIKTAQTARQYNIDTFTTTLLISPFQKHALIHTIGDEAGQAYGVIFHFEDYSSGFRESHKISHELDLYHQSYCGCVYSEWERYGKVKIK